jgi:hypothetical protein
VDVAAKEWIETRLLWLSEKFPRNAFTSAPVVLPTPEFFPDPYDRTPATAVHMFHRVCDRMEIPRDVVTLEFFERTRRDHELWFVNADGKYLPNSPAGTFSMKQEGVVIRLCTDQLERPEDMVGTMSHELSHLKLRVEANLDRDLFDDELITDLTSLHMGFGIFMANSPRNWESTNRKWPGTELVRPEYMSANMYGYALAHLAWIGESGKHQKSGKPKWAGYLDSTARAEFNQGLHYLRKTGDSKFKPR